MAMNPMQKKSRNFFFLGAFIMLIVAGVAIAGLLWHFNQVSSNTKTNPTGTVYVLSQGVNSGAALTADMITPMQVDTRMIPADNSNAYSLLSDATIAKINISAGTPITSDMIAQSDNPTTDDLRLEDFNMIKLPVRLEAGNYIDVRLTLPSGQDFLVVGKKQIQKCDDSTIWIELSESETSIINNAIIESYIMTGSTLYATTYVDPGMQKKPIPTYPVSTAVMQTILDNPNIIQAVKDAYTGTISTDERTTIERALSAYSTSRQTNIEAGVQKSDTTATQSRLKYIDQLNTGM
ncbi:MAG: SAF domain-containing protein [Oscillospiraceae bacterium]|nr:SAF domain-containing protein [Oscillospiraceae bacterium]